MHRSLYKGLSESLILIMIDDTSETGVTARIDVGRIFYVGFAQKRANGGGLDTNVSVFIWNGLKVIGVTGGLWRRKPPWEWLPGKFFFFPWGEIRHWELNWPQLSQVLHQTTGLMQN